MASNKFLRLLRNFNKAVEDRIFKGAEPPETWNDVEKAYKKARQKLTAYVTDIENNQLDND